MIKYLVFLREYFELRRQAKHSEPKFRFARFYPFLNDKTADSGNLPGHYFYQDLSVARRIHDANPDRHVDIGSRIDGFVAHVASFREIEVLDIRPLPPKIQNVEFRQKDIMSDDFDLTNYCDSVSSLHVIEHFGLGRYGDKIDYLGYLKGLNNIHKMLEKGGKFYFSVPIGEQRIEFNSHRVFSVKYLIELLTEKYRIDSFSYVDDDENLVMDARLDTDRVDNNYSCRFGCGIFELTKTSE